MYRIGVDLGGTNIAVGIVDENNKILAKDKLPTLPKRGNDAIVGDMATLTERLLDKLNAKKEEVISIGIAAPGIVDPKNGKVKYCNNIEMFDYPIAEKLSQKTGIKKVFVENDANAAALAEAVAGAGKGKQNVIMITLGTGVGGGMVLDGKLYSGFNYCGAELGHIVIKEGGRKCTCGRNGCWETYSSATGLINMTKDFLSENKNSSLWQEVDGNVDNVTARTAYDAKRKGNKDAEKIVDEYQKYLACGLTNIINIFQPEVLCIGGGVCGEGDYLLTPIKKLTNEMQYGTNAHDDKTEIKIATLGNDAGIIGAALLER